MFKRNKTLAGILAIFLGTLGIHKFYQGKWKEGIAYFLFFWTGIPTILGILDGAKLLTEVADEVSGENVPEKNKKDSIAKSDKKDRSESKAKSEKADKQDKAVKTDAAKKEKATKLEKPEKETDKTEKTDPKDKTEKSEKPIKAEKKNMKSRLSALKNQDDSEEDDDDFDDDTEG